MVCVCECFCLLVHLFGGFPPSLRTDNSHNGTGKTYALFISQAGSHQIGHQNFFLDLKQKWHNLCPTELFMIRRWYLKKYIFTEDTHLSGLNTATVITLQCLRTSIECTLLSRLDKALIGSMPCWSNNTVSVYHLHTWRTRSHLLFWMSFPCFTPSHWITLCQKNVKSCLTVTWFL